METTKKRKEVGVHRFGQVATLKGDILENGKYPLAIIAGLFAPEINIKDKVGQDGPSWFLERGRKELSLDRFGKAGKCKVEFENGISASVGDKVELLSHP